jgi:hypothetical protein
LQRCSKCKLVWYCSPECQKKNWRIHKIACNYSERIAHFQK